MKNILEKKTVVAMYRLLYSCLGCYCVKNILIVLNIRGEKRKKPARNFSETVWEGERQFCSADCVFKVHFVHLLRCFTPQSCQHITHTKFCNHRRF